MKPHDRISRINELLKQEIAELIERWGFKDGSVLISVTSVQTSADLRHARVFVSIFGGDNKVRRDAAAFLEKHRCEIQKKISHDIILKYTPVLEFVFDKSFEEADKVLAIIRKLEENES